MPDMPQYKSPHPLMKGTAVVQATDGNENFTVNFDTGHCDCQWGEPFRIDSQERWKNRKYCAHKLKVTASLCAKYPNDIALRDHYELQVGLHYNMWEAISTFHKQLRRGNVDDALFWATVLLPHRGTHGIVNYMLNIQFEETRDINLFRYLIKLREQGRGLPVIDMQRAVRRFCAAPKKWDLPNRLPIFLAEMTGYRALSTDYGYNVARAKDIIEKRHRKKLVNEIHAGYAKADCNRLQYGLKGLFKSVAPDHDKHKLEMFNLLVDIQNGLFPNKFEYDERYVGLLHTLIMRRIRATGTLGYHELNAYADALSGETPGSAATLTIIDHKLCLAHRKPYRTPLGRHPRIPLYAQDNHTHAGKAKMRAHPDQLRPGAIQTDLDFRLCGAYMGVAWRYLAVAQHGNIDVAWGDVKWNKPKNWLWEHLDAMWY